MSKVKEHFHRNKSIYIGTAVGVAGLAGGVLIARKNTAVIWQYKPENSPVTLTQVVELVRRGHPGKVLRDLESGEVYASLSRAAEATGKTRTAVRDLIGSRFEYLGDAQ